MVTRSDVGGTNYTGRCVTEAIIEEKKCFFMVFFQKGGGVSADPKVLSHFFFALKQSKANKCQCAKRLKTVKRLFLKFFVKLKSSKSRLGEGYHKKATFC